MARSRPNETPLTFNAPTGAAGGRAFPTSRAGSKDRPAPASSGAVRKESPGRSAAWCGTRPRRGCSFFSAHGIIGPLLGQVDFTVQQTLKAGGAVAEMHADDAVVDLAAATQPLPRGADGMHAALGRPGFVKAANGLLVSVFAGDQLLALVARLALIPLDRFHETL